MRRHAKQGPPLHLIAAFWALAQTSLLPACGKEGAQDGASREAPRAFKKGGAKRGFSVSSPRPGSSRLPPFEPPRKPCAKKYLRLLSPKAVASACPKAPKNPISTAYPKGCLYRYPGSGAVLIMESPSYKALRRRFPMARTRRFDSRRGFSYRPKKGDTVSVVLAGDKDSAFVIQAPESLCLKKKWLALVRGVASRLSSSDKSP